MVTRTPRNANQFIEQQLDERAATLAKATQADVLGFSGPLIFGVDDVVRNVIENVKATPGEQSKLIVVLTTLGGYLEVVQRIADTFRHHYEVVDFFVPNHAYSAGTVLEGV